jgi:heme exporter protein A
VTATPPRADIELEGVARTFGPVHALVGVDLAIPAGSKVALMGDNGAGKTTLLRVIAGLAAPTSGTVRIAGVDRRRAGSGLRAMVGYVGHESMLYGELTVRENLAFHASLHDLPARVVVEVAERLDVDRALDRPVRTLSRGNRQRAALARALLSDPAIVLLDEPYTGLDLDSADRLAGLLDGLHRRGHTVVMAVHDVTHAAQAQRLVVLSAGRPVLDRAVADEAEVAGMVARLRSARLRPVPDTSPVGAGAETAP